MFNKPYNRVNRVAELQHFSRLGPEVIDAEHRQPFQFSEFPHVMRNVSNVASMQDSHLRFEVFIHEIKVFAVGKIVQCPLKSVH